MISLRYITNLFITLACSSLVAGSAFSQTAPAFSKIVVFGDSLSDTGNVRDRTDSKSGGTVRFPSGTFNYSDGRWTNSRDTDPGSATYVGVWHEQLARTFLAIPAATYSLGGGTDYAFGGATTNNGTHTETVVSPPFFGDVTITIDDMGKQMDDYLASHVVDPNALYIVWGGGNDLFNDDSSANVTATAARATALMVRLANAGAKYIMVPNIPPLGLIPEYAGNPAKQASLTRAAADYRFELSADLSAAATNLAAQGIMPTLYPLDVWTNTIRVMTYPSRYGFVDISSSVQGKSGANPDQYLFWDLKHPTTAGHYQTAKGANDALTLPFTPPGKAVNLATRVFVDTGERIAIAGFIVTGNVSKKVLIRGMGPSLAQNGVPTPLANPTITLFDNSGTVQATNDDWRNSPDAVEITSTGIAPKDDRESAIIATLPPGNYTVALAGKDNGTGNGLVEVYDLATGSDSTLGNVSTRGFVGAGDNVMIGGIIIGSGESPIVVLRAMGPTLTQVGISQPLLDPTLELHDQNGAILAFNDNWKQGQPQSVIATQLAPGDDREAVIVAFATPGNYTAVVRGKNNTTGVALVEAYRIP
ncbi:MAG TPA: SGNH/GDSL hydrolase family protein [Chthoniobacterales bacterium]|nr:SGNH/GDSL hydrolase family protein [Chthoniobacterales bacterium]